jgi:hypothetical protein
MTSPFAKEPLLTHELADFRARCLVNGSARHSKSENIEPLAGQWSGRFKAHPWAALSDKEGWGRDLRQCCIHAARQRILAGIKPNDIQPEDVMPEQALVDHWRDQARRAAEAYEWRKANPDHRSIKGNMEIDPVAFLRRLGITQPEPDFDPNTGEVT